MEAVKESQQIFIVISQTGTILSRILKLITKAEYNHVSLGLSQDLQVMYSFGRRHPYNPFWGGFVTESPNFGTFKRFYNTKCLVLSLEVDSKTYFDIEESIKNIQRERKKYHYNYLGVCFAAFKKIRKSENSFYCSEFVKEILQRHGIEGADKLSPIVQPIHFLNIPYTEIIYKGKLRDYAVSHK